jgi:hypothetical protein
MMAVAETFANHTNQLESKLTDRTQKLEIRMGGLEKEIAVLKRASL